MQEKSLSTDGGFSFSGSIQEVIKFCEEWKKPAFAEKSQFTEVKLQIHLPFCSYYDIISTHTKTFDGR